MRFIYGTFRKNHAHLRYLHLILHFCIKPRGQNVSAANPGLKGHKSMSARVIELQEEGDTASAIVQKAMIMNVS